MKPIWITNSDFLCFFDTTIGVGEWGEGDEKELWIKVEIALDRVWIDSMSWWSEENE